jgi:hypothetical protein
MPQEHLAQHLCICRAESKCSGTLITPPAAGMLENFWQHWSCALLLLQALGPKLRIPEVRAAHTALCSFLAIGPLLSGRQAAVWRQAAMDVD